MKYYLLFSIVLFTACDRSHEARKKEPFNINSMYGLENGTPDIAKLKTTLEGLPIYSALKGKLDFASTELRIRKDEDILIYMVKFLGNPNKIYAVKVITAKTLVITDEVLYSGKMGDEKNGSIGILKNGEALAIDFRHGQRIIRSLSENEYRAEFSRNENVTGGFCQRRKGQNFGDCYKHEVDEFCDSFFSCLAVNTQPQVHILIALACSCNAAAIGRYEPRKEEPFDSINFKNNLDSLKIDTSLILLDTLP